MSRSRAGERIGAGLAAALAGMLLAGCGGSGGGSGATPVEEDPSFRMFRTRVADVLDRRCGSCHAQGPGMRERATLPRLRYRADGAGRLSTGELVAAAWEGIRTPQERRGMPFSALDRGGVALESPLVRKPLAEVHAGVPRDVAHPEVFVSLEDPDLATLTEWVELELGLDEQEPRRLEGAAEEFFAGPLTEVLVRRACFSVNCHGSRSPTILLFKIDPGIPAYPERFTPTIHKSNRQEMLGLFNRLIPLDGDPARANQILKCIPLDEGGLVHRAGNEFFRKGDPDWEVFKRWVELEQEEARQLTGAPLGETRGLVFVRRPRDTPERFFEDTHFLPGGDLFWRRSDGTEVNLTAALHPDGPADIRAPEVSYDATRVIFSMRRSEEEPFDLWEVELEGGAARQLTFSEDPDVHYMEPLYVPDPDDRDLDDLSAVAVVFSSNREGYWSQSSPSWILGEAEGGVKRSYLLDQQRNERRDYLKGRELRVIEGTNEGYVGTIVKQAPGQLYVDPPFPEVPDSTTHYIVPVEPRFAPKFDTFRMRHAPPGEERAAFEGTIRQLTYGSYQVRRPTMRSSGRYITTMLRIGWQNQRPVFMGGLWRFHVDGSDPKQHNSNRSWVPIVCDDRELVDGLEVRIGRDADSYWGGMLQLSDFRAGPPIETFNAYDDLDHPFLDVDHFYGNTEHPYDRIEKASSLTRFFRGWINLDHSSQPGGVVNSAYRDPFPMPDGSILVARARGNIDLHDPDAAPNFDIVKVSPDPAWQAEFGFQRGEGRLKAEGRRIMSERIRHFDEAGFRHGKLRIETVVSGPESELWPRPVWVRMKEPVKKRLNPAVRQYGPPGEVANWEGYPDGTPAIIKNYDQVLLDHLGHNPIPAGVQHLAAERCPMCAEVTPVDRRVEWARIVGMEPLEEGEEGEPVHFMIAEIPLEDDGSFLAALPSQVPYQIQSLNRHRMALRNASRFRYHQPGEVHRLSWPRWNFTQNCGACHGGLTGDPADARRRIDGVTRVSPYEAGWDLEEGRPRDPLGPFPLETWRRYGFEEDIRPLVDRRCVSCHGGEEPAGGLDLEGPGARAALRALVDHRQHLSSRSYLIEKLVGRELQAPRSLPQPPEEARVGGHATDRPHPEEQPLTWEERLTFIRWIDLGAR